jgi:hypothetical protein
VWRARSVSIFAGKKPLPLVGKGLEVWGAVPQRNPGRARASTGHPCTHEIHRSTDTQCSTAPPVRRKRQPEINNNTHPATAFASAFRRLFCWCHAYGVTSHQLPASVLSYRTPGGGATDAHVHTQRVWPRAAESLIWERSRHPTGLLAVTSAQRPFSPCDARTRLTRAKEWSSRKRDLEKR